MRETSVRFGAVRSDARHGLRISARSLRCLIGYANGLFPYDSLLANDTLDFFDDDRMPFYDAFFDDRTGLDWPTGRRSLPDGRCRAQPDLLARRL
ncbi:hypothetical protein [Cohnella sp. JJ-181]|uniref:hypothetical protein n=1 Tax=Cohnella rhizoplanae TaxID=2974897 RepID=UPI00232C6959|nr:hypothetical protein [Cohnella sp. JJ-181]